MLTAFHRFWFGRDPRLTLRLLQIFWAALIFADILSVWHPQFDFLFSSDASFWPLSESSNLRWWNVFAYFDSNESLRNGLSLLFAALGLLAIGVRRARAAALALYLVACFHHVSPLIWV